MLRFHRNLTGFQLQYKPLKVSKNLSGSRWALFEETISFNDFYYFVPANELGWKKAKIFVALNSVMLIQT